jgi:hypothetical protein
MAFLGLINWPTGLKGCLNEGLPKVENVNWYAP